MEASWHQNRIQNRGELRMVIFRNGTSLASSKLGFGGRSWVEVGSNNPSKMRQTSIPK